jgi:hypothetical protein
VGGLRAGRISTFVDWSNRSAAAGDHAPEKGTQPY